MVSTLRPLFNTEGLKEHVSQFRGFGLGSCRQSLSARVAVERIGE